MRILFDALGLPPYGGAKSSAIGWIRSVAEARPGYQFVAVVSRQEPDLVGLANLEQLIAPPAGRFGVRAWAQRHLPRLVRESHVDLVHFAKNLGSFLLPCPTVITINDLNRLRYPSMFSRVDVLYWQTVQRALFRRVDQIIAISENTKLDLLQYYHLPADKVQVIYPAISPRFGYQSATIAANLAVLQKYELQAPYVLSVGGLAMHKNIHAALRAFASLRAQGHLSEYTFVIVGEGFHTHNDQRLLELTSRVGKQTIRLTGAVDDADLPLIYASASLFVYPSLYEGFGIAPLEAMACGVPVLASRAGALSEVLGDAAWSVEDATDVEAIAAGMLMLLTDASTRTQFQERGLKNAKRFSWAQTAEKTLALYQCLLQDPQMVPRR